MAPDDLHPAGEPEDGLLPWELPPKGEVAVTEPLLESFLAEEEDLPGWEETAPSRDRQPTEASFIAFELAGVLYVVAVSNVVEVGSVPPLCPLPHVPDWLLGVTNLRGDILSVVDLNAFFRLPSESPASQRKLLVARTSQDTVRVGLLVDRIRGIRRLPAEAFQANAAVEDEHIGPYVQGVCPHGETLLVGLDLERLLLSARMQRLDLA
jgi:purine-binding chemotaxis protein CheW